MLDEVKEDEKYLWVELMVRKPHFLGSVLILDMEVRLGLEDWGHDGLAKATRTSTDGPTCREPGKHCVYVERGLCTPHAWSDVFSNVRAFSTHL